MQTTTRPASLRYQPLFSRVASQRSRRRPLLFLFLLTVVFLVCGHGDSGAEVVTQLPGAEKVVALTFDACETKTPSFLDETIASFLLSENIPFTVFASGKFARRNAEALRSLAASGLVAVENHSLNHRQHMERLGNDAVVHEVIDCERLLSEITGRKPRFFRFPAGNYDHKTLRVVEGLGYQVVHWSFASGDPDKRLGPQRLSQWVLGKVRPGNILIFHINGRGYSTGEALPEIVGQLRARGYRFVRLDAVLVAP